MAIRIRQVRGVTVALCAAETDEQCGDIYLDDGVHHALSTKFGLDWHSEGIVENPLIDDEVAALMETQKIRDAKTELMLWLNS